jgi:hypothetical protein
VAHGELALDLQSDDQEKDGQQPVVDPVEEEQGELSSVQLEPEGGAPPGLECGADGRVAEHDREHRHESEEQSGRRPPSNEIQSRSLNPVPERAEHGLGQRALVPGSLVAAVVDKEGRCYQRATALSALGILLYSQLCGSACGRTRAVARRQIEFRGNLFEIVRRECRPALHECVVHRPELASRLGSILRQFCGCLRIFAAGEGTMPEDVPHPIPEPVSEIGNHFMRGVTIRAAVAAVLDQRQFRLGISQDMIAPYVDGAIEPGWSCMCHEGFSTLNPLFSAQAVI